MGDQLYTYSWSKIISTLLGYMWNAEVDLCTYKKTVISKYGKLARKVNLEIGTVCKVEPLDHRKTKHRGRRCEIVQFLCPPLDQKGEVLFLDNKRLGRVDLSDLIIVPTVPTHS